MRLGTWVQIGIVVVVLGIAVWEFVAAFTAIDCVVEASLMTKDGFCDVVASCDDGVQRSAVLDRPAKTCPHGVGALYSPMYGTLRWTSLLYGYMCTLIALVLGVPLAMGAGYLNPRSYEPVVRPGRHR